MDIFGYQRTYNSNAPIASQESAIVMIGGRFTLGQRVQVDYGQSVKSLAEIGNPNVYFVPGPGEGSVTAEKLVGPGGFFQHFRGKKCGRVSTMSISAGQGTCTTGGGGQLTFEQGLIERVSLSIMANQQEMAESGTIRVGSMAAA